MRKPVITIKDIARELNISASTVSRALKDHPDISEETKEKVVDLARKSGYRPNAIALSLKNQKSNVIGVVIPEIVHHFFSSVISGIDKVASGAGYNVLISQSNESMEREIHNVNTLIGSRVDGILLSRTKETTAFDHFRAIQENGIPMVFFDRPCQAIDTDRVIVDDEHAAHKAVNYLIEIGCRKIAHFKGPKSLMITKKRLEGYQKALVQNHLSTHEDLIVEADSFALGEAAVNQLIERGVEFDAIFAVNDMTALGAIAALKKHNIQIPDQVSVIGFTNGAISRLSDPPLTTIEQHGFQMGAKSAEMLLERIQKEDDLPARTEVIPTELIVRQTTK